MTVSRSGGFSGERLSVWAVLKESVRQYSRHWKAFTGVLCGPVLQIMLGAYGCVLLSFAYMNWITERFPDWLISMPAPVWGGYLVIVLGMFWLFKKGFLKYALYFASLNRNVKEALQGEKLDFKAAYQEMAGRRFWPYMSLLGAYCAIPLLFFVPGGIMLGLSLAISEDITRAGIFLLSIILMMGAGLLTSIFMLFATYVFQIGAFDEIGNNPLPALLKSCRTVWRAPWRTLCLQMILLLLTSYLPVPIIWLMRLTRLMLPLDWFHDWAVTLFTAKMQGSLPLDLPGMPVPSPMEIAQSLSDAAVGIFLTSILLPLGAFAFTMLYLELQNTRRKHFEAGQNDIQAITKDVSA